MAQDSSNQIFTAADFKILLTLNNGASYVLKTTLGIDQSISRESEDIFAIGQTEAIASKRNAAKYSGSLEIQVGEAVQLYATAGIAEGTQIEDAQLSIVSITGTPIFARVYKGMNINDESMSIKAKDKDSKMSLKWNARAIIGA